MKTLTKKSNRRSEPGTSSHSRKSARPARMSIVTTAAFRMQIKSILVPIDFSAPSKQALAYAAPLARQFGAKLTLMHVVEIATPDFAQSFSLANQKVMAVCKGQLEHVMKEQAIEPKLVEKTLVRQGRSFHEIANAASTLKVDLIILSTHGYTGLKHALLGSTTERVVRHAPCPVLVVRARKHDSI
jgi:nucleotide-binding universal stress UspA family protein